MPTPRKCSKCSEPTLMVVSRKMELYNSVYKFECSNCGEKVDIVPQGSIAMQFTVSALFAGFVWFVFMEGGQNGWIDYIAYSMVVLALPIMSAMQLQTHYDNPVVDKQAKKVHLTMEKSASLTQKPVTFVENLGFLAGLLAPLLVIAVVLGIAAAIGYVNFTFFGK